MRPHIRPFQSDDLAALYEISLRTGDRGGDATALYADGRLMGEIYSAPYAHYAPDLCQVIEDSEGVGGFVLGVYDTAAFEAWLDAERRPALRARYAPPEGDPAVFTPDERRIYAIHHPRRTPTEVIDAYPAHLHLNLLPRLQRQGWGGRMVACWIAEAQAAGVRAAHVGVNAGNHGALAFWRAVGFAPLPKHADANGLNTVLCGRGLS